MPIGKIEAKSYEPVVGVDKVVMRRPSTDNSNKPGTINGLNVRNSVRDSMHGFPIPARNGAYTPFGSSESLNDLDTTQFETSGSGSENEVPVAPVVPVAVVAPAVKKHVRFDDKVTVREYENPNFTAEEKAALWATRSEIAASEEEDEVEKQEEDLAGQIGTVL